MRARMAILFSPDKKSVQLREVVLKNKPAHMCKISIKSTVPVLFDLESEHVIDESLEIMLWALNESDLVANMQKEAMKLIELNDHEFKSALDKYKYFDRFPEVDQSYYLTQCLPFLQNLDTRLAQNRYLLSNNITLADLAIFPFIRQFAHVDLTEFSSLKLKHLDAWLTQWLEHDLFKLAMKKYQPWQAESEIEWFTRP
ncbi:glutathione S-transferase [Marinicellulosiphila megalodicopiae]